MNIKRDENGDAGFEGFASRWSRRKSSARTKPEKTPSGQPASARPPADPPQEDQSDVSQILNSTVPVGIGADNAVAVINPDQNGQDSDASDSEDPVTGQSAAASRAVEEVVLPSLESLNENSDYSPFMAPNVSTEVRNLALRKLFSAPMFNITDGLDDYDEDFTYFEKLGDIVTADMRHHTERKEALLAQENEQQEKEHQTDDELATNAQAGDQTESSETTGAGSEAADAAINDDTGNHEPEGLLSGSKQSAADQTPETSLSPQAQSVVSTTPNYGKLRRRPDQA